MSPPSGAILLLLAYGAGLATGLARFSDPRLVVVVLLVATIILRRGQGALLAIAALGGVLAAAAELDARTAQCTARLPLGESRLVLRLIDPGQGSGRVELPGRCLGSVMVRWPRSSSPRAGESVAVTARWLPRTRALGFGDGLLVVRRIERRWGTPGPIDAARNWIASTTDLLYGERAPMVAALLVGWRGEIDPAVQQAFTAAGLVHILAISGFHVGLLAGWVLLVLHLLGVRRHPAEFAAAAAAIGYSTFLGWPAPAARAALLGVMLAWCRWRQRQVAPGAMLALSAFLVLLIDPSALVSIGAWLSVTALLGVTVATRWSDRAISEHAVVRSVVGSVGAMLTTAPLTAFVFGQVAPIGILLNLVAVPLAALLVPALLASLVLHPVLPAMAAAFAASGGALLVALQRVAEFGAAAPGAGVAGSAGAIAAAPWLVALALGAWAVAGRATAREAGRRVAWGGVAALWLTLITGLNGPGSLGDGHLALVFADVGQGDAALIRTPGGHWILIDAGPADARWNAGTKVLLPLLRRHRVSRIDALLLSHAHRDHVGGAAAITEALPVGVALDPGESFEESAYFAWLEAIAKQGTRWHPVSAGEGWELDGVSFRVVHPPTVWPSAGEDLNEDSSVLEIRWRDFRALLMGDAGVVAERALAGTLGSVDLLKVGHHGSRTASGAAFLAETRPRVAVVSVGQNRYGHPTPEAIARLGAVGARIWRTDREGHITVETDGHEFTVRGASGLATFTAGRRAGPRRRRAPKYPGHHARALHPRSGTRAPRRHGRAHQPAL
jgi:competence protein ComEC